MLKSLIKEICIMILLCLAIALVFGILFYDYIPISKTIPNKVAYTVSEEVQKELDEDVEAHEIKTQTITYIVSSSDLNEYQRNSVYQPGNPDPFQAYSIGNTNATVINGNTIEGNNTVNGNTLSGNNTIYYYPTNFSTK